MASEAPKKKRAKNRRVAKRVAATKKVRLVWGAERVFLAWIRTSIALIALGFLIARLGHLLQLAGLTPAESDSTPWESTLAGLTLMGLGGAISLVATWRFRVAHQAIRKGKMLRHSAHLSLAVGVITALVSFGLIASFWVLVVR